MAAQIELPGIPAPEKQELAITPMSLMQIALETGKADQLQILQEMYFKDLARKAEIEFNLAMNAAQAEISRIVPNAYNAETKSKWATYDKIDRDIRPIYIKHGFSLSFDSGEASLPEHVRAFCYVSHKAGHTRKYQAPDMPLPTKGAKGGAVMTATHGTGAAMSYAMRYLLKYIFNIAIGEDDTDGNGTSSGPEMQGLDDWCSKIRDAHNYEEMDDSYKRAFALAHEAKSQSAKDALIASREAWRKARSARRP